MTHRATMTKRESKGPRQGKQEKSTVVAVGIGMITSSLKASAQRVQSIFQRRRDFSDFHKYGKFRSLSLRCELCEFLYVLGNIKVKFFFLFFAPLFPSLALSLSRTQFSEIFFCIRITCVTPQKIFFSRRR